MLVAGLFLIAYLLGSIPSAVWLGLWIYEVDVRQHGSKNAGATNTFRVLGRPLGLTVLLMDVAKGFLAVQLAFIFSPRENFLWVHILTGLACVLGHIYSVFVSFKGGKGVATSLGVYLALNPYTIILCLVIFLVVFFATRYVSLASIIAALSIAWISYFVVDRVDELTLIFNIFIGALIVFAHRKNIQRLLKGKESKMNLLKTKA